MQTIGEKLQEARTRQGITIRDAADATKVRSDYLEAMERNQFEQIPLADVYRKGFLKIYAKFLRCDPERFLSEYETPGRLAAPRKAQRETFGRLEVAGSAGEKTASAFNAGENAQEPDFSSGSVEVVRHSETDRKKFTSYVVVGAALLFLAIFLISVLTKCGAAKSDSGAVGNPDATVQNTAGGEPRRDSMLPAVPETLQYNVLVYTTAATKVKIYQDGNPGNVFLDEMRSPSSSQQGKTITVSGNIVVTGDKPDAIKIRIGKEIFGNPPGSAGFRVTSPVQ